MKDVMKDVILLFKFKLLERSLQCFPKNELVFFLRFFL